MNFLLQHTPVLYLTQSFWRDEAFSVLLALKPLVAVFHNSFEPPLYYILLHFWIKIFGTGEIAVRSLSLVGFTLASCVVVLWGEKLFKKHWLSWYLPLFFFINPMLLYYAFEARAYAWYLFFAVTSIYSFAEAKWLLYTVSTILGLYTHSYMVFIPLVELIHYLFIQKKYKDLGGIRKILSDPMVQSISIISFLFVPWIVKLSAEFSQLKQSWYFPIDSQLVKSVVANIFLGYEGTPNYLWSFTAKISIVLIGLFLYALASKKRIQRNSLFFCLVLIPLGSIIWISYYKPLFVNRYFIPTTVAEIFLVVFALENIHNKYLQKLAAIVAMVFVIGFNIWYPTYNKKLDIRSTVVQVNSLMEKQDVILVDDALTLYEAMYYGKDSSKIYWYNPENYSFPWYIGNVIYSPSKSVTDLPPYPIRAFIIHLDGSYEMTYSSRIVYSSIIVPAKKSKTQ